MSQAGAKCLSNGIAFDVGLATGVLQKEKGMKHARTQIEDTMLLRTDGDEFDELCLTGDMVGGRWDADPLDNATRAA